jgi:hypothetical protein
MSLTKSHSTVQKGRALNVLIWQTESSGQSSSCVQGPPRMGSGGGLAVSASEELSADVDSPPQASTRVEIRITQNLRELHRDLFRAEVENNMPTI